MDCISRIELWKELDEKNKYDLFINFSKLPDSVKEFLELQIKKERVGEEK